MSAYIDKAFYDTTYKGESVAEADFPTLVERASAIIDELSFYRIGENLASLATYQQNMVKMATAAQVEYLQINGGAGILNEAQGSGASLGKYSEGSGTKISFVSTSAISYLAPTGLMYRGLG